MKEKTEIRSGDLVLRLEVGAEGRTVSAVATLENLGSEPWEYTVGGDFPPLVQIEARAADGKAIYEWRRPFFTAHWMRIESLDPGESLTQQAEFEAEGTVYLRAFVSGRDDLSTAALEVELRESEGS